jgi:hypothetical protein
VITSFLLPNPEMAIHILNQSLIDLYSVVLTTIISQLTDA